ncbi:DUF1796 family putative cysteine peptidase [Microcoleus sp. Pol12A5]
MALSNQEKSDKLTEIKVSLESSNNRLEQIQAEIHQIKSQLNHQNKLPLVSICIPTYNGAEFLAEALASCLAQTYPAIEIIISDDESTDETLEIAKDFQSKASVEFRVISHSRYGLAQNWNFCILQAQGKYIKFLHQDDLLEPTCIEKMITLAEIDDEIGIISSARGVLLSEELLENSLLFGCQQRAKDTHKFWSNPLKPIQVGVELLADPNLLDEPMNKIGEPTTVLIRKIVFDKVGLFDSDLCQLVDVEMWLRIMSKYKVGFINEILSHWRVHPKQKTIINSEENVYHKDSVIFYKKLSESIYLPSYLKQEALTQYFKLNKNNQTENFSRLFQRTDREKNPTIIVSAVVSTYNSQDFIQGCLESLVNQTLYKKGELEIIVINSGSNQNEEVTINKFQSNYPNIKCIKTKRETLYKAWNRGIQQSSGRYVINANTDDRFSQDTLERMLMEIESSPEISAVYGHWMVTQTKNDNFDSNTNKFVFEYPEFFPPLFFYYQITSHAALIRKNVFDSIGYYDDTFKVFGDREFMFRFASAGLIAKLIPHVVGLYYENPESLSLGNTGKDVGGKEFFLVREQYLVPSKLAKLFGKIPSDIETNLASLYTTVGSLGKDFYIWDNQPVSDLDFAEKTLQMALEIDHRNLIALNNLAILYCGRGEYLKAEGMFEKALENNYSDFTKEVKRNLVTFQGMSNNIHDYAWIKPSYTSQAYLRSLVLQADNVVNKPLVSIIIPTKNRAEMLEIAVQSILEQTYENIEIIVINDHGVDVQKLLEGLNYRGNIFYVKHDYPKERSATRNAGIGIAKGKYIGYLDDDDLYYPNHIQTLVEFLEKSEYKVAYTDAAKAEQEKQDGRYVTINRSVPYSYDFDPDLLMVNNYIPILCVMHERACLEQTGVFDETLDTHEDWDLWIRMSLKFQMFHIKQTTCEFTWRTDGSTTTSRRWDDFERTREIVRKRYSSYVNVNSVVQLITKQPLVSVIIPTKNRPQMLKEAIQSVFNQTFVDLEIIVINDGGVDVQSIILHLNNNGNIVYKKHDRALERSAARNTGIRAARGKYIAYLDDDDSYYPNHIETLVKFLENSEYKIAYTDAVMAEQKKQNGEYVTVHRSVPYSLDFDKDKILVSNCTPNLCLMHEKSCLDEVGLFDETLSTHEDWDLIIRLSRKFDIAHIKETTCEFTQRKDGTNTSSHNRADFTRTREIIFNRYRQYAEANSAILDAQKEAFIAEAKELAHQVQQIQSQVIQKESQLQETQAEKSQLAAQVETWQRTTQEVQAKLEATQSEKDWVKSQLNSWKQTAEEMQIELDLSRLKLKEAQSQLVALNSESELEKNSHYTIKDCYNVGGVFPEIPTQKITKLANTDELMLIPIGAWCRTAYQVREFNTSNNTTSESFPFDWTITTFAALQRILSPEFNPAQILDLNNLYINKFGSLSDSYSDLIFHHDLSPALVRKYHSDDRENFINISPQLIDSGAIDQAKGRFLHTFSKLKDYCKSGNQKIGFIRWCRSGHPDPELPSVFTDENIFSLYQLLQSFCGHNKFYVLRIMTKYVDDLPSEGSVLEYHKYSNVGASILLAERPGYNGDRSNNFAGDCRSWTEALTGFTLDFEIDHIPRY